jgi:hypothetical protein
MTQTRREPDDDGTPMRAVSHTNPYTNESMGSLFEHGVTVVADGGRRNAADEPEDEDEVEAETDRVDDDSDDAARADDDRVDDDDRMKDVSHEAPDGGHGNRMFERVGDTADVADEE